MNDVHFIWRVVDVQTLFIGDETLKLDCTSKYSILLSDKNLKQIEMLLETSDKPQMSSFLQTV